MSLLDQPNSTEPADVARLFASATEPRPSSVNFTKRTRRSRVDLAGVGVDRFNEAEVIQHVLSALQAGRGGRIVTPNADILSAALQSEDLRGLVARADLIVPDGVPLLWLARLTRGARLNRVTGADLIFSLSAAAADTGFSIFLLGGPPGSADRAACALQERYPGLQVVGTSCPQFGFDNDWDEWVAAMTEVVAARPHIVFCGLGFPKQERLAEAMRPLLPSTWFVGCGAAISFAAGDMARAPQWMQDRGLEWLFRLAKEPRRLFRRYIIRNLPFILRLLVTETLTHPLAGRGKPNPD